MNFLPLHKVKKHRQKTLWNRTTVVYLNTNLSLLRKKWGLTQGEMAEVIGLTQSAIGLYESGDREPSLKNLIKIAEYFSVSIDDLLL